MSPSRAPKPLRFLTAAEVAARLGIHRKTFSKYLRQGRLRDFPAPRLLTASVRRWLSTEVEVWMEQQPVAKVSRPAAGPRRAAQ